MYIYYLPSYLNTKMKVITSNSRLQLNGMFSNTFIIYREYTNTLAVFKNRAQTQKQWNTKLYIRYIGNY